MDTEMQTDTTRQDALISAMVNTYRELNFHFRRLPEGKLTTPVGGESARDIIRRMRYDEMRFAQALKQRVTGVVIGEPEDDERLAPDAVAEDSSAMLISQFGTARETSLSLLKDLSDEDWTRKTDDGEMIIEHVQDLVDSDQTQIERIKQILK